MEKDEKRGEELAKVLWYYNLLPSIDQATQKIVCPFHSDVNPSMIVNLADGSFFCFGCNVAGDAKRFVELFEKQYNGLNSLQAYQKYLKILKSDKCSDVKVGNSVRKHQKPRSRQLYVEAYDYYHGLRKVSWRSPEMMEEIEALKYMNDRGFSAKTLEKCKAKVTYNSSYMLIFPMLDNGKFRGWVCRTTIESIAKKRKYLYNEGFSRATTLVGDYGSKDYVIVVEGYMDRLKLVQLGVDNVVAILGWKMTDQQIKKLKDAGVTKVISALDNDECGRKGSKYLRKFFKVTRWCYLKSIKDPGDFDVRSFKKMFSKTMARFRKEQ